VALPEQQDAVSAKGFSLGYLGSSILLILCLILITFADSLGLGDAAYATRLSFILVALWWIIFAERSLSRLPSNIYHKEAGDHYIWKGWNELLKVLRFSLDSSQLKRFLLGFFLLSIGVQTTILVASLFGEKELQLESNQLILTILIIQFVGIVGATLFSRLSARWGNIKALSLSLLGWVVVCTVAFTLHPSSQGIEWKFYSIAALVGLVLGGTQSLSRSTYSKLLPETEDHASFFSLYDVSEKIAIVLGTFLFGYLEAITGSMHRSILYLAIFFVVSVITLYGLSGADKLKASEE
jgi:UMF1 family MFS transporter